MDLKPSAAFGVSWSKGVHFPLHLVWGVYENAQAGIKGDGGIMNIADFAEFLVVLGHFSF